MRDIHNRKTTTSAAEFAITPEAAAALQPTKGERAVDWGIYKGVNIWLNYLSSVAIMDLFLGHSPEKKTNDDPTSFFAEIAGGGVFGKAVRQFSDWLHVNHHKLSQRIGDTAGAVFSLNMGGHICAVLVKLMSHKRAQWARYVDNWLDKFSNKKPTEQELRNRQLRYQVIEKEAVKSWGRVILGRLSGMLFNMGFYQGIEYIDRKFVAPHIKPKHDNRLGLRRFTQMVGDAVQNAVGKNATGMRKKRLGYWPEIAAADLMMTFTLATVMEKVIKFGDNSPKKTKHRQASINIEQQNNTPTSATAEPTYQHNGQKEQHNNEVVHNKTARQKTEKNPSATSDNRERPSNWAGERVKTYEQRMHEQQNMPEITTA